MTSSSTIAAVFGGGRVRRFHTLPTVGVDTVASHSFGVAMLVTLLCGGKPRAEVLIQALKHDLPEAPFGDIPAPAKAYLAKDELLKAEEAYMAACGLASEDLTKEEWRTLKLADNLDGLRFCIEEYNKGNRGLLECERNYCRYITDMMLTENEELIFHGILNQRRSNYERQ